MSVGASLGLWLGRARSHTVDFAGRMPTHVSHNMPPICKAARKPTKRTRGFDANIKAKADAPPSTKRRVLFGGVSKPAKQQSMLAYTTASEDSHSESG